MPSSCRLSCSIVRAASSLGLSAAAKPTSRKARSRNPRKVGVGDCPHRGPQRVEDQCGLFVQWPAMGAVDAGKGRADDWRRRRRWIAG